MRILQYQMSKAKGSMRQVRNSRSQAPRVKGANGSASNGNGQARTPLLPMGVNNKSTMPAGANESILRGEEVISIINVTDTSVGQVVFNQPIVPQSVLRMRILAGAFQRIDWIKASIHLVALNGSVVTSGYVMGFIEDPEITVPQSGSAVIPFLTALRQTTVRQAWVESESGIQCAMKDKPEMFTQPGTDPRRLSPGRVVIATAGDVGTAPTTFMVMLKYHTKLYIPLGVETQPGEITVLNAFATVNISSNNTLSTSPWFVGSISAGTSAILQSDMMCVESGNQAARRIRVVAAGTQVRLNAAQGVFTVEFPGIPAGEAWEIAEWTNAAGVIAMPTTVRSGVFAYSGESQ